MGLKENEETIFYLSMCIAELRQRYTKLDNENKKLQFSRKKLKRKLVKEETLNNFLLEKNNDCNSSK